MHSFNLFSKDSPHFLHYSANSGKSVILSSSFQISLPFFSSDLLLATCYLSQAQIFSIGLRSGDLTGQSTVRTLYSFKKSYVIVDPWICALSC